MEPDATAQMLDLLHAGLANCHEVTLSRPQRKLLLTKLLLFYELHVPGFSGVNTPEILELVLG